MSTHWSTGVLALVAAGAFGASAALLGAALDEPEALRSARPVDAVPVEERSDDDARLLRLSLVAGGPRTVAAPRSGVLTSLSCASGEPVRSGSVIATVDGEVVIALATDEPLWRDLEVGTEGSDVRGFQRSLSALGFPVADDGRVGPRTVRAAQRLLRSAGSGLRLTAGVPLDRFAWIPADAVPARACDGTVGTPTERGAPLVSLPVDLVGATVAPPAGATPGAREVRVGQVTAPVDPDGVVRDRAALAAIASTPEYASATVEDGTASIPADWRLHEPETVLVVPPAALYDLRDDQACVQVPRRREAVLVAVVGSELGQSYVRAPSGGFSSVLLHPDAGRRCR
ncbi:peptidoglycan-binding protein [Curtobacterium sp. MCBA15_012]|uniref:peptidoglycan-binding domain-containing protein n=1 Tax=Curtobacterium sp. MCBA15_012 TaxID=1898738 RepID=UPI0008DCCB04|nr:hypothetical protein [Curtobacterium sp. MCBA15_012]WIB00148.1 hypothetical protein QOL15_00225 [Curtobacterium sp. MCBA15_012]